MGQVRRQELHLQFTYEKGTALGFLLRISVLLHASPNAFHCSVNTCHSGDSPLKRLKRPHLGRSSSVEAMLLGYAESIPRIVVLSLARVPWP